MSPENPLFDNLRHEHGFQPLRIEGQVPADLRGTLYRAGPGLFERFGRRVTHPFEADGAVSAVRLEDDGAQGAARVVRSSGFVEEESKGRFLYNSKARWLDRIRAGLSRKSKATGNTSMFHHQGKLYALMEGSLAQEIDPSSLDALGERNFETVNSTFSAHPRRVAQLQTTFNFGVRYEKAMWLDLYALPDKGPERAITSVEAPWMSMVHDFIATETHLVLFVMPAKLVLWRAILGLSDIEKLFRWDPQLGTQVIVVPLSEPEKVQRFELDAFWVWHFVNGFRTNNRIVIDACRYDGFSLGDIGHAEAEFDPTCHRLEIDLDSKETVWTPRGDHHMEFPQVHPRFAGAKHTSIFSMVRVAGQLGIGRTSEGEEVTGWFPEESHELSEPVLVPRSGSEDDAWVLTMVADQTAEHSYLAVLDSKRLEAGPIAQLHFEQTIPLTFHGTFVADETAQALSDS